MYVGMFSIMRCDHPDTAQYTEEWVNINEDMSPFDVVSLVYDGAHDIFYAAGSKYNNMWQCLAPESNSSWTAMRSGLADLAEFQSLAFDSDRDVLYASVFRGLASSRSTWSVFKCAMPGPSPTWIAIGTGLKSSIDMRSLIFDSAHNVLYGGSAAYGVWRYYPVQQKGSAPLCCIL